MHSYRRGVKQEHQQQQHGFTYPGVFVSAARLARIRAEVLDANASSPVADAHAKALRSRWAAKADTTFTPRGPPANGTIECGWCSNEA